VAENKQDRELIELLNELRVALPGVQVMFAFLLAVPFTARFPDVTSTQRNAYFLALVFTTISTAFLIGPTSYHRLRWRERDKEQMLQTSNRLTITGTVFLALAMTSVVFLITDVLFGTPESFIALGLSAALFAWLWYGLPLMRAAKDS